MTAIGFLVLLSFLSPCLSAYVCDVTGGHLGTLTSPPIWTPLGAATIPSGVVFADSRNHMLRMVDPESTTIPASLTTIAGIAHVRGGDDGDVGTSTLSMPYSVSVDPGGSYALIADYGNACIRNLTTLSHPYTLTTLVCGGLITSPSDIAISSDGAMIYISDPMSHTILGYDIASGSVYVVAGSVSGFADGDATLEAQFNQPLGIALHLSTGDLYIADWLNDAIRVLHSNGTVTTLISGGEIRGPKTVRFVGENLLGISDSDNGVVIVVDLLSGQMSKPVGNGTRMHADPFSTASAVWGITSSGSSSIVFTEADTGSIRKTSDQACTAAVEEEKEDTDECNDSPDISDVIDAKSYLFTTGDSAFLSLDAGSFITSRLPPSISGSTRAILSMPHANVVDGVNPPITRPSYTTAGTGPALPWNITMYLKTVDVYMDTCRIQAKYSMYPGNTGASAVLSVSIDGGGNTISIGCNAGALCTSSLSQCRTLAGDFGSSGWTTSTRSGSARILVAGGAMSSIAQEVTFHRAMAGSASSGGVEGIYVDSPRGALIPGGVDQYVMKVYADSGRYSLFQWGIAMNYDAGLLSFQSLASTSSFNQPLVTSMTGRVSANTIAKSTSPQGSSILIATVTFSINGGAGAGVHPSAFSGIECLFLVNPNSNQFVTSSPARVFDSIGVRVDGSSSLQVSGAPIPIGIMGVSSAPYVITRPDGGYHGTSVSATAVRTVYNSADTVVSLPQCTAGDVGVLSIPGGDCGDIRPSSPSIAVASPASVVWVTDPANPALAPYPVDIRAFVPYSVRLVVEKGGVDMVPMEMRRTRVMVRWSGDPGGISDEVDVTRTPYDVAVVSSNPSAVNPQFMQGFILSGAASGGEVANLTLSTMWSSAVEVSVSVPPIKEPVYIMYYRSITWDTPGSPIPTFNSGPSLSQEGDSHIVVGVSSSLGTLVRVPILASSNPSTYYLPPASIANENGDGYAWTASIPVDSISVPCVSITGQAENASSWNLTSRDLVLPIVGVVSLELCCSYARDLSPSGDALVYAGHSVLSYSGMHVTARMSDGTSKLVTNDARMSIQVIQNTCGATVSWKGVVSSVTREGSLSMMAIFKGVTSNIAHLRSVITVGVLPSISLHGGGTMSPPNTLKKVNCASGVYQSIRVSASLITSIEGLIVPISNQWMNHWSSNGFVLRHSYQGQFQSWEGFSGASAGQAVIFSYITVQPSVPAGDVTMTVVDTSVLLHGVQAGAFPSDTLLGPYNFERKIGVSITMEGGTTLNNILNGGWPDYTPAQLIPSLITIGSNAPLEVATSNERGTAILLGNSPQPLTLSASASVVTTCDGRGIDAANVQSSVPVAGNIDMIHDGDVDIGRETGVPIPPLSGSLSGNVDVRIRSPSLALKAFDLVVMFDVQRVHVHSCAVGSGWSGSFACTVNNAEGYAQIIGADVNSNLKGNSLRVAVLVLSRVSTGIVRLSGVRIKVSTAGYTNVPCGGSSILPVPPNGTQFNSGSCPFIAGGDVPVLIGSSTRAIKIVDVWGEDLRRGTQNGLPSFLVHHKSRALLQEEDILGDCNADGVFDITDYLFAQEFYNGATQLGCPSKGGIGCQERVSLSPWQDAQLHPVADPNAATGGRDLFYLFNTYADKLRFAAEIDFRSSFDYLHLGVRLVDRAGLAPSSVNTKVLFAIMTSQRGLLGGTYDNGTGLVLVYAEARAGGWFVLATHDDQPIEPVYPTSFDAVSGNVGNRYLEDELNVGIAFSVETADGQMNWDLDPSRRSPFFGIHAGSYGAGFSSFAPYAIVNLTSSDLCKSFFPWMSVPPPPIAENSTTPPPMATLVGTPNPLWDGAYQAVVSVVAVGINHTSVIPAWHRQTWIMHPIACFLGVDRSKVSLHSIEIIQLEREELDALGNLTYNEDEMGVIEAQGGAALVTALVISNSPEEAGRINDRLREGMTPSKTGEFSRAASVGLGEAETGANLLSGVSGVSLGVVDSGVWRRFYQPPPPPPFSGGGKLSCAVWWGVLGFGLALWLV